MPNDPWQDGELMTADRMNLAQAQVEAARHVWGALSDAQALKPMWCWPYNDAITREGVGGVTYSGILQISVWDGTSWDVVFSQTAATMTSGGTYDLFGMGGGGMSSNLITDVTRPVILKLEEILKTAGTSITTTRYMALKDHPIGDGSEAVNMNKYRVAYAYWKGANQLAAYPSNAVGIAFYGPLVYYQTGSTTSILSGWDVMNSTWYTSMTATANSSIEATQQSGHGYLFRHAITQRKLAEFQRRAKSFHPVRSVYCAAAPLGENSIDGLADSEDPIGRVMRLNWAYVAPGRMKIQIINQISGADVLHASGTDTWETDGETIGERVWTDVGPWDNGGGDNPPGLPRQEIYDTGFINTADILKNNILHGLRIRVEDIYHNEEVASWNDHITLPFFSGNGNWHRFIFSYTRYVLRASGQNSGLIKVNALQILEGAQVGGIAEHYDR